MQTVKKFEPMMRPGLIPLTDMEAKVYFTSDWYREQIKARRRKLIADGLILFADDHPNNPKPRVTVMPNQTVH